MSDPLLEWLERMGWTVSPAREDYVPYSERTGKPLDPSLADFERRFGGRTVSRKAERSFSFFLEDLEADIEVSDALRDRAVKLSGEGDDERLYWLHGKGIYHALFDPNSPPNAASPETFLAGTAFTWSCRQACELEVELTGDTTQSLWSTKPILGSDAVSRLHMDEENGVYGRSYGKWKTLWFKSLDRAYAHLHDLPGGSRVKVTSLLPRVPAEASDFELLRHAGDGFAIIESRSTSQSAVRFVKSARTGQKVILLTSSNDLSFLMEILAPGRHAGLSIPRVFRPSIPLPYYESPHDSGGLDARA